MKKTIINIINLFFCIFIVALEGCKAYSFRGTNLNQLVKTFSIPKCDSEVALGPVDLDEILKRKLESSLKQRSQLKYVDSDGDVTFEVVIKKYEISAEATKADSEYTVGSIQRLTIEIEVTYKNSFNEEQSFEKKIYSHYADASSNTDIESEEPRLIKDIFNKISNDIMNDTVCNW